MLSSMGRRDFVKTVGVAAVGAATVSARASVPDFRWSGSWYPAADRRLSARTHELAEIAQRGDHGQALLRDMPGLGPEETRGLTQNEVYVRALQRAAATAPLRILPGELIVGSATLFAAAAHMMPGTDIMSTSHTTLGWDRVLTVGYNGLRREIEERLARGFDGPDERPAPAASPIPPADAPGLHGNALPATPSRAYWWEAPSTPDLCALPLTVECRVKLTDAANYNVPVANRNKDSRHHWELFSMAGTGAFTVYLPGYSPDHVASNTVITDGEWRHLGMVLEQDQVRLYVDGKLVKTQAIKLQNHLGEGTGALTIGGGPQVVCGGLIDSVRITRGIAVPGGPVSGPLEALPGTLHAWNFTSADDRPEYVTQATALRTMLPENRGEDLLRAMLACLDAADTWRQRHLDLLDTRIASSSGEERANYAAIRETLERVPNEPPRTFREAVQSLWFAYAFQRLAGTWSGVGRIDAMLGPYLERDLREGRCTLDEARETLAHFWVKGCEWIGAHDFGGTGDAQHYQNIILAGADPDGREITNEVTYLVLDIVEELHISDFPIAVRLSRATPDRLLRRIAEVQRHGGGVVACYNEEVVIEGLVKFGYDLEEARTFANDGCWETLIPGKTAFSYAPFDALGMLHAALGITDEQAEPDFPDFESLYAAYHDRIALHLDQHAIGSAGAFGGGPPSPLVSILVEGCIEQGRSYYEQGAKYNVLAPHAGGLANVANSLLVLKKLVYEDGRMTWPEMLAVLRSDWEGQEPLRRLVQNRFPTFGNDADEADAMMERVFNDYTTLVARTPKTGKVLLPAGISTFGREIGWSVPGAGRGASPDGHRQGAVLATNFSPSPGTDRNGPTAVLQSYCKMDFTRTPNGATVELKVHPDSVRGEEGVEALVGLMKGFVKLGGMFVHIDVVDSAMLLDAQRHPEKYPNLAVRISGWSARFATMNRKWQDMVIARTQQYC